MDATTQIYLEITPEDGELHGEALAGGYEKRIDIQSFHLGIKAMEETIKGAEKKDAVGNLKFGRIQFDKVFDRSSLLLAGMLRRHAKFQEARIAVDQQYVEGELTKIRNEVLILCLYSGYVADIKLRTSEVRAGAASIVENIELSFENFSIDYYGYAGPALGDNRELGSDYRLANAHFETNRPPQEG